MNHQLRPNQNSIAASWQHEIERLSKNPFLLNLLLKQWQRVLERLTYFYAQLATLSRRNRRALQRVLATSLVGTAMLLALSNAPIALANSITVTGACTLSGAIQNANDTTTGQPDPDCAAGDPTGADTIYLTADVTLTAALPTITSEVTLEGGNFFVSGDNAFQVFAVSESGDFTLNETTVKYGNSATAGGGIANDQGTLELNKSTVSGNTSNAAGGGIHNYRGTATINDSTISGNTSKGQGAGIFSRGTLVLNNSTVSGNTATSDGGGLAIEGEYDSVFVFSRATLNNTTVTENSATGDGGGIHDYYGRVTFNRSIVSGNTANGQADEFYNDNLVPPPAPGQGIGTDGNTTTPVGRMHPELATANNYNLFGHSGITNAQAFWDFTPGATDFNATSSGGGGTHVPTTLGNILNTTLANNGGTTETHALITGSPAIDKAPNTACSAAPINGVDQRGMPRNVDINGGDPNLLCDIGAYELQATTAVNVTGVQARVNPKGKAIVKWRTTNESQIAGFNVFRKKASNNSARQHKWKQVNGNLKQAKHPGDAAGAAYRFVNRTVKPGKMYRYKVQVVYLDGHTEWTEVVKVQTP